MDLTKAYQCPVTGRFFDPLRVQRKLLSAGDVNAWITETPRSAESEEKLISAARDALSLSPIDAETGAGWTDSVVLDSLDRFTVFLAGKDETEQTSPTSAPCTGCP